MCFVPTIGEWRSLVAHLTGGQVAAGSNPVSPTIKKSLEIQAFRGFFVLAGKMYPINWTVRFFK